MTSCQGSFVFDLCLKHMLIGTLTYERAQWKFQYSDEFKEQKSQKKAVRPIINFPDPEQTYRSHGLWPFFANRIPSASQPRVALAMREANVETTCIPRLLCLFGERCITDPFTLTLRRSSHVDCRRKDSRQPSLKTNSYGKRHIGLSHVGTGQVCID